MRVNGTIDPDLLGCLVRRVQRFPVGDGAVHLDGLADEPDVEVKTDTRDVPGLLRAQHVARTTHLQVLHGDGHARPEVVVLGDRRQPVV